MIVRGALLVAAALLADGTLAAPRRAPQLPQPRYRTVAVADGGRIYLLGGLDAAGATVEDVESFAPRSGAVRAAGALALPTHGSAAALFRGRILVFGGASTSVHDTVQWYQPASGRTRVIATLPGARADVTAAVAGGRVVLVGGFDGVGPQGVVWASSNGTRFSAVARLPQPVRYAAVAASGAIVYVFGGLISGGEYDGRFSDAIQRVDVRTGVARIVGRLPAPLAHAMAANVRGRIYVLGGSAPSGTSSAIERFLPGSGRVAAAGALPHPLTDAGVATAGSTIYLLGGISGAPLATITAVRAR